MIKFFMFKFFYVMGKALSGELSCPCDRSCLCLITLCSTFSSVSDEGPVLSLVDSGLLIVEN